MARSAPRITVKALDNIKPTGKKRVLTVGDGLQAIVSPKGSIRWNFNFYHPITKARINKSLGTYPATSLKEAKERARECKGLVERGVSPVEHYAEQTVKKRNAMGNTFELVAVEWLKMVAMKQSTQTNHQLKRVVELHLLPLLGDLPVANITRERAILAIDALHKAEKYKQRDQAARTLSNIMEFALYRGSIDNNPCQSLLKGYVKTETNNHAALPYSELYRVISDIDVSRTNLRIKLLFKFQLHTLSRSVEAAHAEWSEIDFDNCVWTIPPEKMKKRREHRVPLTKQAVKILKRAQELSGSSRFVFPQNSNPHKPTSRSAIKEVLSRLGYQGVQSAHGLRSIGSTHMYETTNFNTLHIEACLAHVDRNQTRATYNRTDYLEQRREIMEWWSNQVDIAERRGSGCHLKVV